MHASAAPFASRAARFVKGPRARRWLWWIAGFLVVFAVVGFLVVPPIAKSQLQSRLSEALHRPVTVEALKVNPFVPSLTVRGFAVRERDGKQPFAGFDELYVNLSWTSLFRLAPVVHELTLTRPQLHVVRNPDGTYNFQDLIDEQQAKPPSPGLPRFALFNIRVADGQIEIDDRAATEKHTVSGLRIGLPFISTLPAHVDVKVLPEIAATVNGAPLELKGESVPFKDPHATAVRIDLEAFDVTRLVDYLPTKPRAKLARGLLDAHLALSFEQEAGKGAQLRVRGETALRDVALTDARNVPAIAWKRLAVKITELDPLAPRIDLDSVTLEGAEVHVVREESGALNLAQLGPPPGGKAPAAPPARPAPPLALKIGHLAIAGSKLRFTDQTTEPGFDTVFQDLQVDGRDVDFAEGTRSAWTLSARSDAGETVKLEAKALMQPFAADGRLELAGVALKRYQPYIDPFAALQFEDGKLEAATNFEWPQGGAPKLSGVTLTLAGLRARLPQEKQPFLRLATLEVKDTVVDAGQHTVTLGSVALRELNASVRRDKDGALDLAQIVRAGDKGNAGAGDQGGSRAGEPWRIDLGDASLERGSVTFEDRVPGTPVVLTLAPLQLRAQKLSTAKGQRGTVEVRATVNKTGTLTAAGPLTLDPLSTQLKLSAENLGFAQLQPYVDERLNVAVTSGTLSARGTATVAMPPGKPMQAAYTGDVQIGDFASVDKRTTQDLLRWKTLALGNLDFTLEPLKVSLDQVALSDFYARLILSSDARLNLQDLVIPAQGEAAPAAPAASEGKGLPPNVRIGRITLEGGNVNFSDFYVKPNYSTNLTGIGGTVTEMTPDKAGAVDLRGKVDNAAPVEIAGSVNPLAADLFLDLKASARDVELPPMSPYAEKYAGYGIERGKLSMNVSYHLDHRKLDAQNNIVLDQLTFGERVESPTATKLPVLLAVALLKDRNGVIDIHLPISGSLDDPQFSVGGIIVQVILNLIVKAVTSPFALLGSLFGGGEELSYVEFAPGSAIVAQAQRSKLESLAKALTERPALRLEVAGRVEPEADRAGLKRASLDAKVRAQKFNDLRRAGNAPASVAAVTVTPGEYERYLRQVYGDEKFPKPRNVVGLAKDLPAGEMEKLILSHTEVSDEDLRALANARAQAAKDWLVGPGKVPLERVFILAPRIGTAGITDKDKGPPTRADFALR